MIRTGQAREPSAAPDRHSIAWDRQRHRRRNAAQSTSRSSTLRRWHHVRVIALLITAAAICACSPRADGSRDLTTLNRGNLAETKSLDPNFIDGQWEAALVGDMLMGLTT